MAARECYTLLEEDEVSNDWISNSGSSSETHAEDKDICGFTESCVAVLEPSKDESRRSDGRPRNLLKKHFSRSCPNISTREVSTNSIGESTDHEDNQQRSSEHQSRNEEQTDEPQTNCCATFMDCYNIHSRKIKDSWFIYIFQFLVLLLSASAIVMGIIFFRSCDGLHPSAVPVFTILMGVSGLVLVQNWLVKVCRHRIGDYYWNHERYILSIFLAIFLILLVFEISFFNRMSPKTLQSKMEVECVKTYYYYIYYMHFAIAGSLVLAALLYLPDCCICMSTYQSPVPSHANGHYQSL